MDTLIIIIIWLIVMIGGGLAIKRWQDNDE